MAFSILAPSNSTLNAQLSTTLPSARPATAPSVTAPSMLPDSRQLVTAKAVEMVETDSFGEKDGGDQEDGAGGN